MSFETIEKGQWIFVERSLPGYFIYRLLEGKVSIFRHGTKIHETEVKKGDKPALIGMISTLRPDGLHIASVYSETELKVQKIYSDQIKGMLNNELPESTKQDIHAMIETIVLRNEIEVLENKLKAIKPVSFKIPANTTTEMSQVLDGINNLYMNPDQQ
ncbi:MAG: hypothetical protein OEV92_00225 [Nitrospinota bacterium]|nr:hypothetical protein [Nitrospinota bacterium]